MCVDMGAGPRGWSVLERSMDDKSTFVPPPPHTHTHTHTLIHTTTNNNPHHQRLNICCRRDLPVGRFLQVLAMTFWC